MKGQNWNRRSLIGAGGALLAAALPAYGAQPVAYMNLPLGVDPPKDFKGPPGMRVVFRHVDYLFRTPSLLNNQIASQFLTAPRLAIPKTRLMGKDGPHFLSQLTGKVRLVSLWSEWCVACLVEMPDLLRLQQRFGGAKFEILAILTGSYRKLSFSQASNVLRTFKAADMPLWIEPNGGATLMKALASQNGDHGSLPCNLLIDAHGRIRGRAFGAQAPTIMTPRMAAQGTLTEADKEKMRAAAISGVAHTGWASPEADAFIHALMNGALA